MNYTADEALRSYRFWTDAARQTTTDESLRAALESANRWLGRYDVLSAWEAERVS